MTIFFLDVVVIVLNFKPVSKPISESEKSNIIYNNVIRIYVMNLFQAIDANIEQGHESCMCHLLLMALYCLIWSHRDGFTFSHLL